LADQPQRSAAQLHAKEQGVMKSGSRDKAEGTVDKIAGRVMEPFSKLTGNRSVGAKGKAARSRRSRAPDRRPAPTFLLNRRGRECAGSSHLPRARSGEP
jgi:hypothetical protein